MCTGGKPWLCLGILRGPQVFVVVVVTTDGVWEIGDIRQRVMRNEVGVGYNPLSAV